MLACLLIDALYEANQRDVDISFEAEVEALMLLVKDCLCESAVDCSVDKLWEEDIETEAFEMAKSF
jgi:hypothetical protein